MRLAPYAIGGVILFPRRPHDSAPPPHAPTSSPRRLHLPDRLGKRQDRTPRYVRSVIVSTDPAPPHLHRHTAPHE